MKRSSATKKIETILTQVRAAEIACGNRNYHRRMDKRTRLGQVVGSVRTDPHGWTYPFYKSLACG